jgi:hypothetical protein
LLGCLVVAAMIAVLVGGRGGSHDPVASDSAGLSATDDEGAPFADDPSPPPVRMAPAAIENAPTPPGRIAVCELFRPPMARSR